MAEPGPCTTEVITLSWRWSIRNRRQRAQHDPAVYLATGLGDPYRRASGESYLRSVTGHSHTTVVPARGRRAGCRSPCRQGRGGDTPPFHSSDGFRVAVAGTSCQTGIYRAREGSEVTEFAGGDTFEYALLGDFFVHSETRCSITVTTA